MTPLVEELVGHVGRLVDETAGVAAKVEDDAREPSRPSGSGASPPPRAARRACAPGTVSRGRTPRRSTRSFDETLGTWTSSRTRSKREEVGRACRAGSRPSRAIPALRADASRACRAARAAGSLPSTLTMMSPLLIPARSAGDPSMGASTTSWSLRLSTSMPMPPNSPSVSLSKALKLLGRHVARVRVELRRPCP